MTTGTDLLTYGDRTLSYVFERMATVADKVRIHVGPDNEVRVEAPLGCDTQLIQSAVQKRALWIVAQIDDHTACVPISRRRAVFPVRPTFTSDADTCSASLLAKQLAFDCLARVWPLNSLKAHTPRTL